VYNYAHIGNLRAYVLHDLLTRTLRRKGFEVTHVMNITDIGHLSGDSDDGDDKMVKSAKERGKSVLEIAEFYARAFFQDLERLNIVKPTVICKATEHITDMIELIKRIEANGFTYSAGGNLYFDITKFPHYGELARLKLDDLKAGARTEVDAQKRNPQDFVLWFTKSKFENQALVWDSPWGTGYPGWHIECSAMSIKYLGETFDIHAGGIDHVAIHHTNEIAQSEAATGIHPWVHYWIHNEFLVLDKGKMSKSAGGFLTLQSLIDKGYDPLDYRYFLLTGHYRSQLQFSYQALDSAKNARKSLMDKIMERLGTLRPDEKIPDAFSKEKEFCLENEYTKRVGEKVESCVNAFDQAMDDDLSTPRGLAEMWGLLRDPEIPGADALAGVFAMDCVLGLNMRAEAAARRNPAESPDDRTLIEGLVAERAAAKQAKDFAKADAIRQQLKEKGILLEDRPAGTIWRRA
jgi:cysteinyl-tRNA synthetase